MGIFRTIVFSRTPLRKVFRYKEVFQLVPYTDEFEPKVSKYAVDYPCFLEYSMPDVKDGIRDVEAEWLREHEICTLLTAFSEYRVFMYDIHAFSWGVKFPVYCLDYFQSGKEELDHDLLNEKAEFYHPGFYYKDVNHLLKENEYSVAEEEQMMKLKEHSSLYTSFEENRCDTRNKDAELCFAKDIVQCLDVYFGLNVDVRSKVYSSARLIYDSIELMGYRHSLSLLAGVAALETMANLMTKDEDKVVEACGSCHAIASSPYTCKECGRPIWGVTKKVIEFLKEFVSSEEDDVKNYKNIYNLRSKITHTGDIFLEDTVFWEKREQGVKQFEIGCKVIEYARRGIVGVLRSGKVGE